MAKRFTDTEKFIDPWFRRLSSKHKLLWDWLLCNCDYAGLINIDFEFIEMVLGEKFEDSVLEGLFSDRLIKLSPFKYFIPKFIRFQYGKLNKQSRVHSSVIDRLTENGIDPDTLSLPYIHPIDTTKEKDKEKEKEKDKVLYSSSSEVFDPRKFLDSAKIVPCETSEVEASPKFTPDHFIDLWNGYFGDRLARATSLGGGKHRDNFIKSLEFLPTEKHWRDLFDLCLNSPKVMGQNDIGWTISPTWIVDFDNAIKVLNGDFDDAKVVKNLFASMQKSEESA